MTKAQDILDFWHEIGPRGWYEGSKEIDTACRRFAEDWWKAHDGEYRNWLSRPETALAYIILVDQFPRNIHRGNAEAFATDNLALSAAILSVSWGHDLKTEETSRQFFYLPYEHAENRQAQSRSVTLFLRRLPDSKDNLLHAQAHRDVIRRFGRFPYRNEALGRESSSAEEAFLKDEGYQGVLKRLAS